MGLLTNPLRDRFGIPIRLNFYSNSELEFIINRGAKILEINMAEDGAQEIAKRARGTPRIAGRLLRRVRDFAHAEKQSKVGQKLADKALTQLNVDSIGLDELDIRYLNCIAMKFYGGPVGIETISAALSEPRDAIEEIVEPFLIQQGFVQRTPRGRLMTKQAFRHLGIDIPKTLESAQLDLFTNDREA